MKTRYCWWEKTLADRHIESEYAKTFIACDKEIVRKDSLNRNYTSLKLQFHYDLKDVSYDNPDWDTQLGYCYIYIVDSITKSMTMKFRKSQL